MIEDFFTLPYQQHRDPSYGELCWQVFTSLTIGAKGKSIRARSLLACGFILLKMPAISLRTGILYFTYWCAPLIVFPGLPSVSSLCSGMTRARMNTRTATV